jgi:hypothetical protein
MATPQQKADALAVRNANQALKNATARVALLRTSTKAELAAQKLISDALVTQKKRDLTAQTVVRTVSLADAKKISQSAQGAAIAEADALGRTQRAVAQNQAAVDAGQQKAAIAHTKLAATNIADTAVSTGTKISPSIFIVGGAGLVLIFIVVILRHHKK